MLSSCCESSTSERASLSGPCVEPMGYACGNVVPMIVSNDDDDDDDEGW